MPGTQLERDHHLILVTSTILSRMTIWVVGAYALVQGIGIIDGGRIRWAGDAYAVARQVPGAPLSWGVALIAFGVLTLVGSFTRHWWTKTVGLGGLAAWSIFFGFGALFAALQTPTVGTTGPPVYFKDAFVLCILILVDERRR